MFEFHELITNPTVWALFFGYGIMSSIVIDFINKLMIPNNTGIKQILFYIVFGYFPFVIWMPLGVSLFIGAIGAFFSLLFLLGKEKFKPFKWYSWIMFIIPIVSLLMIPFDFTSKVGWEEKQGNSFVEVEYDYFNGEYLIPIYGDKEQRIYFNVDHQFKHGNSYGMTLYDENEKQEGMNVEEGDYSSVDFEVNGKKYIVVTASDGKQGRFHVEWWKE